MRNRINQQKCLCIMGLAGMWAAMNISGLDAAVRFGEMESAYVIAVSGNEGGQNSVSAGNMELEDPEYGAGVSDGNAELSDRESVILSLQVPGNLDFVIDPWNLSGRGQVYSERFTIMNSGNVPYTLWLRDMTCTAGGGARPVGSAGEIYNEAANVYLELAFENGDSRVLSTESQDYEVVLRPGEELAFRITGAVNEKTTEDWGEKQVRISVKYNCYP